MLELRGGAAVPGELPKGCLRGGQGDVCPLANGFASDVRELHHKVDHLNEKVDAFAETHRLVQDLHKRLTGICWTIAERVATAGILGVLVAAAGYWVWVKS